MKFVKIITASFLAANVFVAAHEFPSDNLITDLAEEYDAQVGEEDYEDELMDSYDNADQSSTHGLRGSSSSFDEEFESTDDVDWQKLACEAKNRQDVWAEKMKTSTGDAYDNAKEHYEEAKAATLRAQAHLSPKAKAAWEATKDYSQSTYEKAKSWFQRHIGGGDDSLQFTALDCE